MPEAADGRALYRLMAWLSPAFPVGAFSYSTGLERAVHDGLVRDLDDLRDWLETLLEQGSGWNDAVLLAESWRRASAGGELADVAELGEALAGSAERHRETMLQGEAFLAASAGWSEGIGSLPARAPYCVAVGAVAGGDGVALEAALAAFLQAFVQNQAQAAIRLSLIGQNEALRLIAALEPFVLGAAARAAASTLDDLGSAAMLAETAAMRHETQRSRLFRT